MSFSPSGLALALFLSRPQEALTSPPATFVEERENPSLSSGVLQTANGAGGDGKKGVADGEVF